MLVLEGDEVRNRSLSQGDDVGGGGSKGRGVGKRGLSLVGV